MSNCQLCDRIVDERNAQEQMGYTICHSCDGKYTDEEIYILKNGWDEKILKKHGWDKTY
jgi:hypothetical protein